MSFSTVRNEGLRLPYFLDHHRKLGVDHFIVVDNGSDDGSVEWLAAQPDVSVWTTRGLQTVSVRARLADLAAAPVRPGHWCLTLDADEILVYPYHESRPICALTIGGTMPGRSRSGR